MKKDQPKTTSLALARPVRTPDLPYRQVKPYLLPSLSIDDPSVTHACCSYSSDFAQIGAQGCGVVSWHSSFEEAYHNSRYTRGWVQEVQRDENGDVLPLRPRGLGW
jgi:hypothetical protein